jgi:hypothetical protein
MQNSATLVRYPFVLVLVLVLALILQSLAIAQEAKSEARPAKNEAELRAWLKRMVWYHQYSLEEMHAVLGMPTDEITAALAKFDIRPETKPKREKDDPLLVMPYPGGRHPRVGFLEGAVNPQRETKLSIFTPWDDSSYVVLDCPEAVWSNLGLTYLAHTHVDTIWTKQKVDLPRLEWKFVKDAWRLMRVLPNSFSFEVAAFPKKDHLELHYTMTNGTDKPLSDLRVQMCAMLKGVKGFDAQTNDNKIFKDEFAACRNDAGDRWILFAFKPIHKP